ncbi:hypothetical protein ACRALDRAFT_2053071 [Sodiomyces alcalophilus JCM 7366]|uniref:uncharacterized protein n=1 Tax=Sodiomyces alcalophilus JCM 7366 TaxID=591952 RepID=UPI0039B574A0
MTAPYPLTPSKAISHQHPILASAGDPGQPYRAAQPAPLSLTTQDPTPSPSPPASSHFHLSKLNEQDLLAALQSIREEEEARLHTRRKSFHIIDFNLPLPPFSPLRVPFSPIITPTTTPSSRRPSTSTVVSTASTSSTNSSSASTLLAPVASISITADRGKDEDEDEHGRGDDRGSEENGRTPYAECGTYQLVHAKERLRDLEQQLQDAVCCLQDYVQVIARRPRGGAEKSRGPKRQQHGQGHEDAAENGAREGTAPVVDALQDKLARLGRAQERLATEHALVTAEIRARAPGMVWDGTMEALARMARGDGGMEMVGSVGR